MCLEECIQRRGNLWEHLPAGLYRQRCAGAIDSGRIDAQQVSSIRRRDGTRDGDRRDEETR